jgi:hypothetical protein
VALVSLTINSSVAPTGRLLGAGFGATLDLDVALHLRAAFDVVLDVDRGVADGVRAVLRSATDATVDGRADRMVARRNAKTPRTVRGVLRSAPAAQRP